MYEDQDLVSVVNNSNENDDSQESGNAGDATKILERNGWYHSFYAFSFFRFFFLSVVDIGSDSDWHVY